MSVIRTTRLILRPLIASDATFMQELVNTEGFVKYIGQRNVHTPEIAATYTSTLLSDPAIRYWVAETFSGEPAGVVTFIKRIYLPLHDIGFAFLPAYTGIGLAFEACDAVLSLIREEGVHREVLATVMPENKASISLLEKLHFDAGEKIEREGTELLLYKLVL